jgi:hypothetical protein
MWAALALGVGTAHAEEAKKPKLPAVEYMKNAGCPFASWFGSQPENTSIWETNLITQFVAGWMKAGSPRGAELNDHNYKTLLGKGNTHGFLGGSLTIDNSAIPSAYRVGLFAKNEKHPLVLRFSDFGADNSVRIGRAAIKLPWKAAWGGEINWLFTETLDTFPLRDGRDLAVFAKDPEVGFRDKLKAGVDGAKSIGGSKIIGELSDGYLLGKEYYSQVPYALGKTAAMRFRLVPEAETQSCAGGPKVSRKEMLKGVKDYIAKHDAVFRVEIQIHPDQTSSEVTQGASKRWTGDAAKYYAVGKLVLPLQPTDPGGMSLAIKRTLQATLKPNAAQAEALHKLFYFHPILTAEEHRPVGEINEFRADFYARHASARWKTLHSPIADGHERFVLPFDALRNDTYARRLFEK